MTTVVAAILQKDGSVLLCQRRADQPHPLKWEFPGGKVEAGETPEEAVVRELREELAIDASRVKEITRYEFAYPGKNSILLIFMGVNSWSGELQNLIFNRVAWEPAERLQTYDFLEGDLPFIESFRG